LKRLVYESLKVSYLEFARGREGLLEPLEGLTFHLNNGISLDGDCLKHTIEAYMSKAGKLVVYLLMNARQHDELIAALQVNLNDYPLASTDYIDPGC
jgi:hypothetical protein